MALSAEQLSRLKEINEKIQNELDSENFSYLLGQLLLIYDENKPQVPAREVA